MRVALACKSASPTRTTPSGCTPISCASAPSSRITRSGDVFNHQLSVVAQGDVDWGEAPSGAREAVSRSSSSRPSAAAASTSAGGARARQQFFYRTFDEPGIRRTGDEHGMRGDRRQQIEVGRHPGHVAFRKRPQQPPPRLLARGRMDDHLRQHRVVLRADRIARGIAGIDARIRRHPECREPPGGGAKPRAGSSA